MNDDIKDMEGRASEIINKTNDRMARVYFKHLLKTLMNIRWFANQSSDSRCKEIASSIDQTIKFIKDTTDNYNQ